MKMKIILFLAVAVAIATGALVCKPSSRFPWIQSDIDLPKPFADYNARNNKCCEETSPNVEIDFDVECALCFDEVSAVPGFMLDPNNCQKFYMCIPTGDGGYLPHHMTCPDCMFWNDDLLSCVEVDNSCDNAQRYTGALNTAEVPSAGPKNPLVSCIDFEDPYSLSSDPNVMYVMNKDVKVVENGVDGVPADFCPQGNRCGFFDHSQLEIPYFANIYGSLPNIRITMDFYSTNSKKPKYESIISTNCHASGKDNSIFFGFFSGRVLGYYKGSDYTHNYAWVSSYSLNKWQTASTSYNSEQIYSSVESNSKTSNLGANFPGLLNSHCPMVIGSPVKTPSSSRDFAGYIDNICFYIE